MLRAVKIATNALKVNKIRTSLTILGIVIGISAVIIVMSAGQGIKGLVLSEIEGFGTDLLEIEVKTPNTKQTSSENAMGMATGISITTLKIDDVVAASKLPNIKDYYYGVLGQEVVSYGSENKTTMIFGVSPSFEEMDISEVAEGRFYDMDDENNLNQVVVLGAEIKKDLFGDSDAIGRSVKIGKIKFKVIGVMKESGGGSMFFDRDGMAYVPVKTLQKKVMGIDHIVFAMLSVYDQSLNDATVDEITYLLRERHGIEGDNTDKDDFAVVSMEFALEMLDTVFGAITILLIALASISLIVGGVGIMNIMYVSVAERTYEIGLRKAVGASSNSIMMQFLWEAIVVTFVGAIVGVIIGILFSFLVYLGATSQGLDWRFVVTPGSLILASGFSVTLGLLFGVWPAKKAANLDPVDALRK
ncbi:ABC transporter permease [Patescibacteria group bacterium]|nr:ABC transporter permease [Patescibacteria group bacterium]